MTEIKSSMELKSNNLKLSPKWILERDNKIKKIIEKQNEILRNKLINFYNSVDLSVNPSVKISVFINKQEKKKQERKINETIDKKILDEKEKEYDKIKKEEKIKKLFEKDPYMSVIIQMKRDISMLSQDNQYLTKTNKNLIQVNQDLTLINENIRNPKYCQNCIKLTTKYTQELNDLEMKLNKFLGLSGLNNTIDSSTNQNSSNDELKVGSEGVNIVNTKDIPDVINLRTNQSNTIENQLNVMENNDLGVGLFGLGDDSTNVISSIPNLWIEKQYYSGGDDNDYVDDDSDGKSDADSDDSI